MRQIIRDYYRDIPYEEEARKGLPLRVKDLHIPSLIKKISDLNAFSEDDLESTRNKKKMILDHEELMLFKAPQMQESLFSFYKGFYNYLAILVLENGTLEHWANITNYYSMFFLAKSVTTLMGKQEYFITPDKDYYSEKIASFVNSSSKPYKIKIDFNQSTNKGEIEFSNKGVNSHKSVWTYYSEIPHEALGLTDMNFVPKESSVDNEFHVDYFSRRRNRENYSFSGYQQLDINLSSSSFEDYFERDYLKSVSEYVCDEIVYPTTALISDMYSLFSELEVEALPIERDKFRTMAGKILKNLPVLEKVLGWIDDDFSKDSEYFGAYFESDVFR